MIPTELSQLIPILGQIPIVVLFAWYSDRKDKQHQEERKTDREAFQAALAEERRVREKFADQMVEAMNALRMDIRK